MKLKGLGHVLFRVADLERSKKFYTEILGLLIIEEDPKVRACFLGLHEVTNNVIDLAQSDDPSLGGIHSDVNSRTGLGFHHAGFAVESHEALKDNYKELKQRGVPIVAMVDHGSTESVYFQDPDGNVLEIYWNRPNMVAMRHAGEIEDHDEPLVLDT